MAERAHSIELNLSAKLKDQAYRKAFFWAQASAEIAAGLVRIRKRRGLSQSELAQKIGTKQSAISRVEQVDYQNWNLKTLRTIAESLDARLRISIEPSEDIISDYEGTEKSVGQGVGVSGDGIGPGLVAYPSLIYASGQGDGWITGFHGLLAAPGISSGWAKLGQRNAWLGHGKTSYEAVGALFGVSRRIDYVQSSETTAAVELATLRQKLIEQGRQLEEKDKQIAELKQTLEDRRSSSLLRTFAGIQSQSKVSLNHVGEGQVDVRDRTFLNLNSIEA